MLVTFTIYGQPEVRGVEVGCSRKGQEALLSKKKCLQTELVKEWAKVSRQTKDNSQGDMCNASLHQERRNYIIQ